MTPNFHPPRNPDAYAFSPAIQRDFIGTTVWRRCGHVTQHPGTTAPERCPYCGPIRPSGPTAEDGL